LGDFLVYQKKPDQARRHYQSQWEAHLSDSSDRQALAKLQAIARLPASEPVLDFLLSGKPSVEKLLKVRETGVSLPHWGLPWYLLGRQLFNKKSYSQAISYLQKAAYLGLEHPTLTAENLFLLAKCFYGRAIFPGRQTAKSDFNQAVAYLTVMSQFPRHMGEFLRIEELMERIQFDRNVSIDSQTEGLEKRRN
jgi:tetratricopeptide (TPR) repeat protein